MRLKNILILLFCLASSDVFAQATGRPLRADVVTELVFPRIALIGNGSGTVTIEPIYGGASTTGSVRIFGSSATAAELQITGQPNSFVSVRATSAADLVAPSGQIVRLQNIQSTGGGGIRLSQNGRGTARIGAILPVSPSTKAGQYKGRIIVAIDYVFE